MASSKAFRCIQLTVSKTPEQLILQYNRFVFCGFRLIVQFLYFCKQYIVNKRIFSSLN